MTGCVWGKQLPLPKSDTHQLPHLTECHCDLQDGGARLHNPQHLAYQDACLQVATITVSHFKTLVENSVNEEGKLRDTLSNLVLSSLLMHCRLGGELFLLCQTVFKLAKDYKKWLPPIRPIIDQARENLLEWIKTVSLVKLKL
ncbi:hypothetical protein PQX77_021600 [Marasmius sp. AFHP31]|nr:hypothetical protein PQX77_021600 [Marasmius sp. AFHP31]